jgi:hypothetical protein
MHIFLRVCCRLPGHRSLADCFKLFDAVHQVRSVDKPISPLAAGRLTQLLSCITADAAMRASPCLCRLGMLHMTTQCNKTVTDTATCVWPGVIAV